MNLSTLVPMTDFVPVPRIEVLLQEVAEFDGGDADETGGELSGGDAGGASSLLDGGTASNVTVTVPEGTDRVTVWRRAEGRAMKVRGGVNRPWAGTLALLDMEAPFDVQSAYELECFAGDVAVGRVLAGTVTLPWTGDDLHVLIQQPLNPSLNATIMNLEDSWPSISRKAPGQRVIVEGARYPSLIATGPRQGAQGTALDFGVATREDAARVWGTLGTDDVPHLPVWLIRPHLGFVPRVFFAHVETLVESDIDTRFGGEWTRFQATVDEVAPPAPGLVAATLTYSDLAAVFGTYSAAAAALPRYSDWASAWDYAGAAGGS